jgi:hypothetical protein
MIEIAWKKRVVRKDVPSRETLKAMTPRAGPCSACSDGIGGHDCDGCPPFGRGTPPADGLRRAGSKTAGWIAAGDRLGRLFVKDLAANVRPKFFELVAEAVVENQKCKRGRTARGRAIARYVVDV